MRKNSMGELFISLLVFVGFVGCIGLLCGAFESKPKCIKVGCENEKASGSSYCYLHKPYGSHYSTKGIDSWDISISLEGDEGEVSVRLADMTDIEMIMEIMVAVYKKLGIKAAQNFTVDYAFD